MIDDLDDFEARQAEAELAGGSRVDGGFPTDIMDGAFNGAARISMYRQWTFPGIHPDERQPVLKNWSDDDIDMFCGTRKGV